MHSTNGLLRNDCRVIPTRCILQHAGNSADVLHREVFGTSGRQSVVLVERNGIAIGCLARDEVCDKRPRFRR